MRTSNAARQLLGMSIACGVLFAGIQIVARQGGAPAPSPTPPAVQAAPAQGGDPARGQGGGRGGGGRGRGGVPVVPYDDYAGFTKIWDGSTFTNWDGERDVWTIEGGTLHADTTKTPGQHHIHYIGPNAVMKDFDLKVEFKISAAGANGGIQYRSRMLHTAHGGTMADPMGKPTPAGITTMDQAIAAGITSNPQRGGGGGGIRGGGAPGAPGAPNAAAPGAAGAAGGGRPAGAPAQGAPAVQPAPGAPAPVVAGAPVIPAAPTGRCQTGGGPAPTSGPANPTSNGNIWQVSGYQFDLDSGNGYTGQLYEGQGRSIVTAPGTFVVLTPEKPLCISVITETPAANVKPHLGRDGEWNQVEIIARGNTLVHMINGKVQSVTIDENPAFRALQGILSLQLEGSGQIWYRNVYVKPLN